MGDTEISKQVKESEQLQQAVEAVRHAFTQMKQNGFGNNETNVGLAKAVVQFTEKAQELLHDKGGIADETIVSTATALAEELNKESKDLSKKSKTAGTGEKQEMQRVSKEAMTNAAFILSSVTSQLDGALETKSASGFSPDNTGKTR